MTTDAFGWYTDKLSKSPTNSKEAEWVHIVQKLEGLDIFESITKNRFKCIQKKMNILIKRFGAAYGGFYYPENVYKRICVI
jgi:hypothetical protein